MSPTCFSSSEIPKNHLSNRPFLSVEVYRAQCPLVSLPVCQTLLLWAIISLLLPLTGLLQFKLCFIDEQTVACPSLGPFPTVLVAGLMFSEGRD